jgi:FixJ family two-component response regulator
MNEDNPVVCVIDDESSIRVSLSNLLRSAGLKVRTFISAQEFLISPPVEALGCLVLDVNLPGISGLDLQRELGSGDGRIPIIFITGHGDIPTSVRAMKAGAIEFLTKPFDDDELLSAIGQAINSGRQFEQSRVRPIQRHDDSEEELGRDISSPRIVRQSPALRRALLQAEAVAPEDALTESEMRRRQREKFFAVLEKAGWKIKGLMEPGSFLE